MDSNVKWVTLENETGERSLKQHGFIADGLTNISLCGRIWVGNGNEEVEDFDKIISEPKHPECCKICSKKSS